MKTVTKKAMLILAAIIFVTAITYIVYWQLLTTVVTDPVTAIRIKESQPILNMEISVDAPVSLFVIPRIKRTQWEDSEELVLILKNNTVESLIYGRDNTFEIELDGVWYYMYSSGAPSFGTELPPREIRVVRHWMSKDVGWVSGHYRVVKEVIKEAPNQVRQIWVVAAEFYLE